MSIFSLCLIYLSFYYLAFLLAYWRTLSGPPFKARNSYAALIVGAVGLVLIAIPAFFAPPGGAAALILIAALALVPVFLLGLGSLLGRWIAGLKPRVTLQTTFTVLALAIPFSVIWQATGGPQAAADLRAEQQRAAFQKATLVGRLGRYPVAVPVSPQINTAYTCLHPTTGEIQQCLSDFGTDAGLGVLPGDIPIFDRIKIAGKGANCMDTCIGEEHLAQWCKIRGDLALQEWCSTAPAETVSFSYDENRNAAADEAGWTPASTILADGTTFECKGAVASAVCRVRYELERNLEVTILVENAKEDALVRRFQDAKDYVDRLWSAMKR